MAVPVTTRLDEQTLSALDSAVSAGAAPTRAAGIAVAVREWLARHAEESIVASYRRAYDEQDEAHQRLLDAIASHSVAAVLTDAEQ